ncbi:MAG TPA: methyltransferase domain-containing protein [Thermoanaerobaculia bacterium]|nr:methyltransferase domain-containing protein [Thermoanaerobaculia bacterium]
MPEDAYVHGTSPEEQARLSRLNTIINDKSLQKIGIQKGERILDVGSGLGQLTRAMARQAGVPAVGIERSPEQLAEARRLASEAGEDSLVDFRQGDALDLPLTNDERGSFDVVHARFLLEHLRWPVSAVEQMVQAARPGGRIVLEDDDHELLRTWPEPPGLSSLWSSYIRLYDRIGNDPIIGRRLVELLARCGARPVRNDWLFFGACSGSPDFIPLAGNMINILLGARQAILEHQLFDSGLFDEVIANARAWSKRGDAALWYCIAWAEGIR